MLLIVGAMGGVRALLGVMTRAGMTRSNPLVIAAMVLLLLLLLVMVVRVMRMLPLMVSLSATRPL